MRPQQYGQQGQRQQAQRPMDMREVPRTIQPGGQRARSPQTSPNKARNPQPQPRSISPVQPAYHPDPRYRQQQPYQQYPPQRPNLQVNVTAPKDPFIDPPRAAFAAPPSPTLSDGVPGSPIGASTRNLLHSPSTQSLSGSAASNPDNDRLAPAAGGQDFWKRFSMVAHEAELEKSGNRKGDGKDPWLSKEFRGTRKFKYGVWAIGLICIGAIAGGLAWHFTHNDGPKLSAPTQHDFGLGGTSSVARSGIAVGVGGGGDPTSIVTTRQAAVAVATPAPLEDTEEADLDIAQETEVPEEDADALLGDEEEEITTTSRRAARTSTTLVARATSHSTHTALARRHRHRPARQ